jgi:hypothetical protein
VLLAALVGCRDYDSYSTRGDHFEGAISAGEFVRAGLPSDLRVCVTLDGNSLQSAPGTLATSNGWIAAATSLQPLPHVENDSLSLLEFGEGRAKTYLYAVAPVGQSDATVFLSLMNDDKLEVRLLRGGPRDLTPDGYVFGVFGLVRQPGPCPF